jgi:hypothetical protein
MFVIEAKFDNIISIKNMCGLEVIVNSMLELAKIDGQGCARFFCGYKD